MISSFIFAISALASIISLFVFVSIVKITGTKLTFDDFDTTLTLSIAFLNFSTFILTVFLHCLL